MDPQNLIPSNPSPLYTPQKQRSTAPIMLIMVVIFGLGTLIFGLLAAVFYNQAASTRATANARQAEAVKNAKAEQKAADDEAFEEIQGSPYRAYIAPSAFGSFEIKFPKHWSSSVTEKTSGTQVTLLLNPDFVKEVNNQLQPIAARVVLQETPFAKYTQTLESAVKNKKLTRTNRTVSGIEAADYTGTYNDPKIIRRVIVPVRDKVVVFSTEDPKYAAQFNEILAQANIIP